MIYSTHIKNTPIFDLLLKWDDNKKRLIEQQQDKNKLSKKDTASSNNEEVKVNEILKPSLSLIWFINKLRYTPNYLNSA